MPKGNILNHDASSNGTLKNKDNEKEETWKPYTEFWGRALESLGSGRGLLKSRFAAKYLTFFSGAHSILMTANANTIFFYSSLSFACKTQRLRVEAERFFNEVADDIIIIINNNYKLTFFFPPCYTFTVFIWPASCAAFSFSVLSL